MPYCASFRAGRFDFVVANVHIYYGASKAGEEQREKEIAELVKFVDRRSKTERSKVFDRDFFVVGDFNIEAMGDRFFKALVQKGFKMPENLSELNTNFDRNKTFDKIAWIDRPSFSFTGKCNVVPFYQAVYQDAEVPGGRAEISDHLPLWTEYRINKLTQELDQIINKGE